MSRISWDEAGNRLFSAGVDRGVLYLDSGIPWTGLLSVNEAPSGSDVVPNYMDGDKFFSRRAREHFDGSIEAYTYPHEFEEYNGIYGSVTGQRRKSFDFSYRTILGNNTEGYDYGYLIHLVYNATVFPDDREHATVSSDLNPFVFKWNFRTAPTEFGRLIGSHLIINSRVVHDHTLEALEDILYGTDESDPRMPTPEEILELFESGSTLRITDHGDGTWTAEGPESAIEMISETMFMITWPSAIYLSSDTYEINSL